MTPTSLQITHIPLTRITPSRMNPRKYFDQAAIEELAASITAQGVLQPILVRAIGDDTYEIIAGERRYRATMLAAGIEQAIATIPAIIRDLTEEEALDIQITENLQRKDLHPMEEANGFHNLATVLNLPAEEIAARVGKSPSYIAQRIKLCDLIDPLQQFFYDGHLLVKDAMAISKLSAGDQQDLYDEEIKEERWTADERFTLNKWHLNKYRHSLTSAPFDTGLEELTPGTPACTVCPHNSAVQTLLFPDQDQNPVCLNSSCFRAKCDQAFTLRLEDAQEDPETVIITGQYYPDEATKKVMKKISGVLERDQYEILEKPEPPDLDDIMEWNDSEEEARKEYESEMDDYKEELAAFEKDVASGKYIKALRIGGSDKGTYSYVKLKKGAKVSSNGSAAADTTDSDTLTEIHRLTAREARAKELDEAKVWDQIREWFDPTGASLLRQGQELSQAEITAIAYAMYNQTSYSHRDDFLETVGIRAGRWDTKLASFQSLTAEQLTTLMRFFMLSTLPPGQIHGHITASIEAQAMYDVAKEYWPDQLTEVETAQQEKTTKRSARVDARIAKLKATLTPKKKATKKPSSKKQTATT